MTNLLEQANAQAEELILRRWKLRGIVKNLYGIGRAREDKILMMRAKQRKRTSQLTQTEGDVTEELPGKSTTDSTEIQEEKILVETFPIGKHDGCLTEAGGPFGWFTTALKNTARNLGVGKGQKYHGFLTYLRRGGICVSPTWLELKEKPQRIGKHLVLVQGGFGSGFYQYFDVIDEAPFEFTIEELKQTRFKKEEKRTKTDIKEIPLMSAALKQEDILGLFGLMKKTTTGVKGRATIEFTSIELEKNQVP